MRHAHGIFLRRDGLRAASALCVALALTGCAERRSDATKPRAAARLDPRCSSATDDSTTPTSPPRAVAPVTGPGAINLLVDAAATTPGQPLEATISNVRDWPLGAMNGSTVSTRMEIADTTHASPLPCAFTAVFADKTCALTATGKRFATRTVTTFPSGQADDAKWRLVVEAVDATGCTQQRNLAASEECVVVQGSCEELRVVAFDQGPGYSGGAGSRGPLVDHDGRDLRPEIARWPQEEQARYLRGPGFSVRSSKARDLFWFISLGEPSTDAWSYRLRDADGKVLLDHEVHEGRRVPLARNGTLLRQGARLFHAGAEGVRQIR